MQRFKTGYKWLDKLMPEGLPVPSSTLISGPGGTGKPLVSFAFVSAWLKYGGSAIGIPLQYPSLEFVGDAMARLYDVDVKNYRGKLAYIQFDPKFSYIEKVSDNTVKANLLKPKVWDEAVKEAGKLVEKSDLGTMIFGSALNLLLFSPTYKDIMIEKLKEIIEKDKTKTYLFSVSTSAFREKIRTLERAADNLMFTRIEKPMKLFFRISKMKGLEFSKEEIRVPIPKELLNGIKVVAEKTRNRMIPIIRKV